MKIEQLKENLSPPEDAAVRLKKCGLISEIRYQTSNVGGNIRKLDKEHYINAATGEVKQFHHTNTRADCKISLSRSMQHLRDLINCNTAEPENCLWVTLTYRENMRDTRRLYDDLRKFFMRLQYHLQKNGLPHCKYILVAEPQGRGAWHAHAILIFPVKAPYIDNTIIARLWGHGFVTVKSLSGVVNAGVYLSAYLGGLELSEAAGNGPIRADQIKEVETVGQDGKRRKRRLSKECGCVCTLPDSDCSAALAD